MENDNRIPRLDILPTEVVIAIFKFLSIVDKCQLCQVCKRFRLIIYNNIEFWKYLDLSPFGERLSNENLFMIVKTRWKSTIEGHKLDLSGCRLITSHALEKLVELHSNFQEIHLNVEPRYDNWRNEIRYDYWIKQLYYKKSPTFLKNDRPGLYQRWEITKPSYIWQFSNKSIQTVLTGSFKTIKQLSLGNQSLHRETATLISNCSQLIRLDLSGTNLDKVSLQDILQRVIQLESLKLLELELSPMTLMMISRFTNLQQLHISVLDKKNVASKTIADMLKKLRKLKDFRMNQAMIGEVDKVVIEGLSWIFCDGPIEDSTKILEEEKIKNGGRNMDQNRSPLQHLDISPKLDIYPRSRERSMQIEHYITISNSSLWSLAVNHPFLISLRLVNAYAISAEGVDGLLSSLQCLEVFELRRWRGTELEPLQKLTPKFCPKLREIVLHGVEVANFNEWIKDGECQDEGNLMIKNKIGFQNLEILDLVDVSTFFKFHADVIIKNCVNLRKVRLVRVGDVNFQDEEYKLSHLDNFINDCGWMDV
ncbi:10397_t:CDS:1 [Funneliformis geosporum]|uniref:8101_t:CDS:1 n=1 Tax=Funneliformis geosporum TaxID=1117311 RepID=A0A9W4SDR5_9GLOM|nr:8101_t:CDS:1 [Funneliformis geosporum]CAI2192384.1 10397_t:CDS:1 [Funneliformis geosporum]